ncbi:hypothetical protein KKD72_02495 [Patescibacteria group bacterium]|nr:hypothetical protein [Patescibacteria group bacterium]
MINQPEKQFQQPSSGPQFESEQKNGQGRIKGWLNRYGSSVILPIVALLILAGGIYLYAHQGKQGEILPVKENASQGVFLNEQGEPVLGEQPATAEQPSENTVPEPRIEGDKIVEKAGKGDGVTNLARRALKDYLQENPQNLTNEHKIYIEDYLKDKVGSRPLSVDEEVGFSNDLIKEAIDASLQLDQNSLKTLEKYSVLVAWQ